MSELGIPKNIVIVDHIPLLGTGKTDFRTAQTIAEEHIGGTVPESPPKTEELTSS